VTRILAVTRIEISAAAYAALAASATRGLLEPRRSPEGGYSIWLAPKALKRLEAVRGPSESYSEAVLRLAREQATISDLRLAKHRPARLTGAGA